MNAVVSNGAVARMSRVDRAVRLTGRELRVLELVAEGLSSAEVAEKIFVSKRTVDFHLANIYAKLGVKNRIHACRVAAHLGLLRFEPGFAYVV